MLPSIFSAARALVASGAWALWLQCPSVADGILLPRVHTCDGNHTIPWACPLSLGNVHASAAVFGSTVPRRRAADDIALLDRVRSWLDESGALALDEAALNETFINEEAYDLLKMLLDVNAVDILAFRETWTDLDTNLLRQVDGRRYGFNPAGELTTAAFAARLPSAEDFFRIVTAPGRVAIVGSGESLRGNFSGAGIDHHRSVVRFNDLVGSALTARDTGLRTTIHCGNARVPNEGDPSVAEFDLETGFPERSYCAKLYAGGKLSETVPSFHIRPSASCKWGSLKQFTRGFMFYWFIGRLFPGVDMYGFSGSGHFHKSSKIFEEFLPFEHQVYRLAAEVNSPQTRVVLW